MEIDNIFVKMVTPMQPDQPQPTPTIPASKERIQELNAALELLHQLRQIGVDLHVKNSQICYHGPREKWTDAVHDHLSFYKDRIVEIFTGTRLDKNPILMRPVQQMAPSLNQEGLLFMEHVQPRSLLNVIPLCFYLKGPLSRHCLERAFNRVINDQNSLRMGFEQVEGTHRIKLTEPGFWTLKIIDLGRFSKKETQNLARLLVKKLHHLPFDLSSPPLFKLMLFCLNENEHLLALSVHHLVFDGQSVALLTQQWVTVYNALVYGSRIPNWTIPVTYAEYALNQRSKLTPACRQAQQTYWEKKLLGLSPTVIHGDRPRPNPISYKGDTVHFNFTQNLTQNLLSLSEKTNSSLFMMLVSGLFALLYRYTDQNDLSIGTAIGGRQDRLTEHLIGLFVNLVTLRIELTASTPFLQALDSVKETLFQALANKDLPFESVVQTCIDTRREGIHPLFNIQIVCTDGLFTLAQPHGVDLERVTWSNCGTARKDLTLYIGLNEDKLMGELEYNTDLFDRPRILRFIEHFKNLLQSAIKNPFQKLRQLNVLTLEEQLALRRWNQTESPFPKNSNLVAIFEKNVRESPQSPACWDNGTWVTYDFLNSLSDRMAYHLRKRGVQQGDWAGLCLNQGHYRIAALLSILKAGAGYVPLDPNYPLTRLKHMISISDISTVITEQNFSNLFNGIVKHVFVIDLINRPLTSEVHHPPQIDLEGNSPAYMMFTSGSTGVPKGVVVPHRAVLRLVLGAQFVAISKTDTLLQAASISFDASTFEIWGTFLHGAKLVLAETDHVDHLPNMLTSYQITIAWLTAQVFHWMVDEHLEAFTDVKQLLAGGEALSPKHVSKFLAAHPKVQLINGYGPTENTTFSCCASLRETRKSPLYTPIGKPIENSTAFVVDPFLQPQPLGIVGELVVGGAGIAWGYHRQPKLTATVFIPDPFSPLPGQRLYRTGDSVRELAQETDLFPCLHFEGRRDRQIKIRGFRIEPRELEVLLENHELVDQAYIRVLRKADISLLCYVRPANFAKERVEHIKQTLTSYLKSHLPAFMQPRAIVVLEQFPFTQNGKLDEDSLHIPEMRDSATPPRPLTPVEELIAIIWGELLECEISSPDHHFFECGGHSLLANRLVGELMDVFDIQLPIRSIFEFPILGDLANHIESIKKQTPTKDSSIHTSFENNSRNKKDSDPSFGQERMWFLEQLTPGTALYSVPLTVVIYGKLSCLELEKSVSLIADRHESLRSFFETKNGKLRMMSASAIQINITVINYQELPAILGKCEIEKTLKTFSRAPFLLTKTPLFRIILLQLEREKSILFFNIHHIIADGWSLQILFQELELAYTAFLHDVQPSFKALPMTFSAYALWQRHWLNDSRIAEQHAFWEKQLKGICPVLDLPLDRPRQRLQSFQGSSLLRELPNDILPTINQICRTYSVTPFLVGLTAFASLLFRYTGQNDICIGTPIANRSIPETHHMIGFFLNTLVLRFQKNKRSQTFVELLRTARTTMLDAFSHQDLPFEHVVARYGGERDLSSSPLFQVTFTWNTEFSDIERSLPGARCIHFPIALDISKFELSATLYPYHESLFASFTYNRDLFMESTISCMMDHYCETLIRICRFPETAINHTPWLSEEEQRFLLKSMETPVHAQGMPLLKRLEAILCQNPQSIALEQGDCSWTYSQLAYEIQRIKTSLRNQGVRLGMYVGLYLKASLVQVAAQCAVLGLGACFVPLETSTLEERLLCMISDAQISIVLSTQDLIGTQVHKATTVIIMNESEKGVVGSESLEMQTDFPASLPAYAIYTSGSSGKPKAVVCTHGGLNNLSTWHQSAFALAPTDRASQLAHNGFDASVWEVWPNLLAGVTVVLPLQSILADPLELQSWLICNKITICFLPTPVTEAVLSLTWPLRVALRLLLTGGDMLHCHPPEQLPFVVVNNYGPTENTVVTTSTALAPGHKETPSLGQPIANTQMFLLDQDMAQNPIGVRSQLYIASESLAQGYLGQPSLTAMSFLPNPFAVKHKPHWLGPGSRLYQTGDLVRLARMNQGLPELQFMGRIGNQVKLRGLRIELGEIEHHLSKYPGVTDAVVLVEPKGSTQKMLIGFVQVPQSGKFDLSHLRRYMLEHLPHYMVPNAVVVLNQFPLKQNGKLDRHALSTNYAHSQDERYIPANNHFEQILVQIWREILKVEKVSTHSNFFELGGHSLLLAQVQAKMGVFLGTTPSMITLFQYPTITSLARHLQEESNTPRKMEEPITSFPESPTDGSKPNDPIAIIGFTGRFPRAETTDQLWDLLYKGEEGLTNSSESPCTERVLLGGYLEDVSLFDAAFFEITPQDALLMDPQQRLILEQAWLTLEHAGYGACPKSLQIGVFAGSGDDAYRTRLPTHDAYAEMQQHLGNDPSFLSSRIAYKLGLRGPAVTVQSACSSSLVAVHLGCKSLIERESDLALAGGVSLQLPPYLGYVYQEGLIYSPDGRCRPFSPKAKGTVRGSGVAMIAIRRYSDAVLAGDTCYALIRASAVNNDGSDKIGFTAPSLQGQETVIIHALKQAGVTAESVNYIEAHGTGTPLGDAIELDALTRAYGQSPYPRFIGSIKGNLGHLDAASGITGLIKTVLCLHHRMLVPTVHHGKSEGEISLAQGAFVLNQTTQPWPSILDEPRRAGVSNFGIGGTNVHLILEEPPRYESDSKIERPQLMMLSGKTTHALERQIRTLNHLLEGDSSPNLNSAAYSLAVGRKAFAYRAWSLINPASPKRPLTWTKSEVGTDHKRVVFLCPGQGSYVPSMAADLYRDDPGFKTDMDQCQKWLSTGYTGPLLLPFLADATLDTLIHHELGQAAHFALGWCLAQWWIRHGISPEIIVGHSLGEYLGATLAGVFKPEDCLHLLIDRARLIANAPAGEMFVLAVSRNEASQYCDQDLSVAASNHAKRCVISGPHTATHRLASSLQASGIPFKRLDGDRGFHSCCMEPLMEQFVRRVAKTPRQPPQRPILSNLTGTWLTPEQALDPHYWARHLRETVMFWECIQTVEGHCSAHYIEVGPGSTLSNLVALGRQATTIPTLPTARPDQAFKSSYITLLQQLGKAWGLGLSVDWTAHFETTECRRIALPTYPFERKHYWIDPPKPLHTTVEETILRLQKAGLIRPEYEFTSASEIMSKIFEPPTPVQIPTPAGPEQDSPETLEPHSYWEQQLTRIWATCLGIETINRQDHFISLGGDSLSLIAVFSRLRPLLPPNSLQLSELWLHPVLEEAAQLLAQKASQYQLSPTPQETSNPNPIRFPLSLTQQQLYVFERTWPDTMAYNLPNSLVFEGPLCPLAMEHSLNLILTRHSALRTLLEYDAQGTWQLVEPWLWRPLTIIGLELGKTSPITLERWLERWYTTPLSLTKPLFRWALLRTGAFKHILAWNIHHLIFDGFSLQIFLRELAEIYNAWVFARQKPTSPPPPSYEVYLRELDPPREQDFIDHLARLQQAPSHISLPQDNHPLTESLYEGGSLNQPMLTPLIDRLQHTCRTLGLTPYTFLLATYAQLLLRYSGQESVCVGSPITVRHKPQWENLIGNCVQVGVQLFDRLDPQTTVRCWLNEVHARVQQLLSLSNLPLATLLQRLECKREPGYPLLFQVLFSTERADEFSEGTFLGLNTQWLEAKTGAAPFFLDLAWVKNAHGANLKLLYRTSLFTSRDASRFLGHFQHLLQEMIYQLETPVLLLPLESETERQHCLAMWTSEPKTQPLTSWELIWAQARKKPDHLALLEGHRKITYHHLVTLAERMVQKLLARGLHPGSRILAPIERCAEWIVALLACLRAGFTWIPIDPAAPEDHLTRQQTDAAPHHALRLPGQPDWPNLENTEIIHLGPEALTEQNTMPLLLEPFPMADAYLIYTSGTTGTPKGIAISQAALAFHNQAVASAYRLSPEDRVLQLGTSIFDVSLEEVLATLVSGATLVVCTHRTGLTLFELVSFIEAQHITVANLSTGLWHAWCHALPHPPIPKSLRLLLFGTEAARGDMANIWMQQAPQLQTINAYGPTETTITVSLWTLCPGQRGWLPLGNPLRGVRFYVMDAQGTPQSQGLPGELWIGGPGVARGYTNKPRQTATAFVPDRYGPAGGRCYRSGDIVRIDSLNMLQFLGRRDRQVKVRGFRLELGNIELALARHPKVRRAVVTTLPQSKESDIEICAYIDWIGPESDMEPQCTAHLNALLPRFMRPHFFYLLNVWPLTKTGKLDYRALPLPNLATAEEEPHVLEGKAAILHTIWCELLHLDRIHPHQDLYKAGAHSLLFLIAAQKIAEQLGPNLPLRFFFENETLAKQAQYMPSFDIT